MFFIVGRGRSGTTLLSHILRAHTELSVAPEALFVLLLRGRYGRIVWNERIASQFARDIWLEERLGRWKLEHAPLERRLTDLSRTNPEYARMCAEIYLADAEGRGKNAGVMLGDKNPHYSLYVRELAELFPTARFIHLTRDYRDNILSFRSVRFDLSTISALAYRWRRYNQEIIDAAERIPDRFLSMRFEDLLLRQEASTERLCRFLGVKFEPEILERYQHEEALSAWHQHILNPLDPAQASKWKSSMVSRDVAIADRICQPLGRRLGYEPATVASHPSRLRLFPGILQGWAFTELERIVFRLPLFVRTFVLRTYRAITGSRGAHETKARAISRSS